MNEIEAVEHIKELLETLDDPISERKRDWIFEDNLRVDLDKQPAPKVILRKTNITKARLGIGKFQTLDTLTLTIQIKANVGNNYAYDNKMLTAEKFVGVLSYDIETLIKSSHPYFIQKGFIAVIPISSNLTFDNKNPVNTLTLELSYVN
jgi:hypothetical protein